MGWWRDPAGGWVRQPVRPEHGGRPAGQGPSGDLRGDRASTVPVGPGLGVEPLWALEAGHSHAGPVEGTMADDIEALDELIESEMVHARAEQAERLAREGAAFGAQARADGVQVVVELAPEDLASDALRARLDLHGCGCVVSFVGVTRDIDEGEVVDRLEFDTWPEGVLQTLDRLGHEACGRFGVRAVALAHRSGIVRPGEDIVAIHVGAAHRGEGFAACSWLIDELKSQAPIWKKEVRADGEHWKPGLG